MCDTSIPITTFHSQPAEQAGTANTVNLVRAGHDPAGQTTCPGPSVWVWLWFPILLCICIGCCGFGYQAYQYWRKRLKEAKRESTRGYDHDPNAPMMEEGAPPYADDYQQVMQQEMDMPPVAAKEFEQPAELAPEPMPVMEPPIEYEAPAYTTNLFGTPSLQQQQMAAP